MVFNYSRVTIERYSLRVVHNAQIHMLDPFRSLGRLVPLNPVACGSQCDMFERVTHRRLTQILAIFQSKKKMEEEE